MFRISNFTDNDDVRVLDSAGPFTVIEYMRDLSVSPSDAEKAYFCHAMNVRKRQVVCDLSKANVTLQSGAMQWTVGNVNATTGLKGVGDFFGKAVRGKMTGEGTDLSKANVTLQSGAMQWTVGNVNATTGLKGVGDFFGKAVRGKMTGEGTIKPEYTGDGVLVLEPTYKHLILLDVEDWNGSVVLDDGLFLACDAELKHKAVMRSNISSAVFGNEGLFNLGLRGNGVVCLETPCPKEELITITLDNDVLKVDGNMAVAWSGSLDFTVERSGKSLIGSAASGEGLVNVYRGTGKILLAPVQKTITAWSGSLDFTVERSGKSLIGSAASGEGLVNVYRGTGKILLAPVQKTITPPPIMDTPDDED